MGPLQGVRVLEVATHVFVPMTGAVLAEWGADVVKVEHPRTGDPYRGLVTAGLHKEYAGVDVQFQAANRGKRSVGLDIGSPEGRSVLARMLAGVDVFLTNLRPAARAALRLEPEDVRADNSGLIYVRGSAFGPRGPDGDKGGYDAGAYWSRSGMEQVLARPGQEHPAVPPAAFGDVVAGLELAGAVGVALYKRAMSGEPSVLDGSLLASGMWQVQMDVMNAQVDPERTGWRPADRHESWNPLMQPYRTSDGRFVVLQLLAPDRHWPELCRVIGAPEMVDDPRFADLDARRRNAPACVDALDAAFAARSLAEWKVALSDFDGAWVPAQMPSELSADAQVQANGYLREVDLGNGHSLPTVAVPAQFDGRPGAAGRAPEHGQHTEEVLLAAGLSWDELAGLKAAGVVL